jgi:hypothetical protein
MSPGQAIRRIWNWLRKAAATLDRYYEEIPL